MTGHTWKEIASARKQKQIDAIPKEWLIQPPSSDVTDVTSVPESCGLLDKLDLEITNEPNVGVILSKLAKGEWSSVQVTTAFYKRAIIAHQLTNCLTEIFVDEALERAAAVDRHLKETGKVIGPLHGLPISLKDQLQMKGRETVMGYVSWVGKIAEEDAVIVQILYDLGAVPFVRTNVPQTMMWGETYNTVFGRTVNPYNRKLTPGGSSGGEGALVAQHGSPLGIGTDIGGSVRIPAYMSGIYGLRPSYARLPYYGLATTLEGQYAIPSVIGPLTSSVHGLKIFTKAILDSKPWAKDPAVARIPWNEAEYELAGHGGSGGQLCFAVMYDNGLVRPHPPVRRALSIAVKALEAAGHKVIDWIDIPGIRAELRKTLIAIFNADGGEGFQEVCDITGEPLLSTMSPTGEPTGEPMAPSDAHRGDKPNHLTAFQLWALHKKKKELQKIYLDLWEGTVGQTGTGRPVDAILCPVAPYAAPPHGMNTVYTYTNWCNICDYTSSVIPVTTVSQTEDIPEPAPAKFHSTEDEMIFRMYDKPETFLNAPVGIQLVGQTLEEEAVIAMTEIVDKAVRDWKATS